jgi:hypothetical protein
MRLPLRQTSQESPVGESNKSEYGLSLPLRATAVYTDDEGAGYGGVFDSNDREIAGCTMLWEAEALASEINSIDDFRLIAREAEDRLIWANLRNTAEVLALQSQLAHLTQQRDGAREKLALAIEFIREEGELKDLGCEKWRARVIEILSAALKDTPAQEAQT